MPSWEGFGSKLAALSRCPVCQRPQSLRGFRVWHGVGQCMSLHHGGFCLRFLGSHLYLLVKPFSPANAESVLSGGGQGHVSTVPKGRLLPSPAPPSYLASTSSRWRVYLSVCLNVALVMLMYVFSFFLVHVH